MTDPMSNPGRRLTQARRRRQKLAVADLLSERFSRSVWFETTHPELPLDDSPLAQGIRRRALSEALIGIEDKEEAI